MVAFRTKLEVPRRPGRNRRKLRRSKLSRPGRNRKKTTCQHRAQQTKRSTPVRLQTRLPDRQGHCHAQDTMLGMLIAFAVLSALPEATCTLSEDHDTSLTCRGAVLRDARKPCKDRNEWTHAQRLFLKCKQARRNPGNGFRCPNQPVTDLVTPAPPLHLRRLHV